MRRSALILGLLPTFLLGTFVIGGCASREVRMESSPAVPAAAGNVEVEGDDNGNTRLRVEVKHLAEPEKLTPPRSAYVVWVQPSGMPAENMGSLRVEDDLTGRYEGTTRHKAFEVVVTAEDGPTVQSPSGQEVMRTRVSR